MASIYLLDSNVFIEGQKDYPRDLFPSYWTWLGNTATEGKSRLIKPCLKELNDGNDGLGEYVSENFPSEFIWNLDSEIEVANNFARLMEWANSSTHYLDAAKVEFAGEPDGWLIAAALTQQPGFEVVTYEKSEPFKKRKIKIPDVCREFNVACVNVFAMMRDLGASI